MDRYEKIRKNNREAYVGKVFSTNSSGLLKILEYRNNNTVRVIFISTGCEMWTRLQAIMEGRVKDPMKPTVYEVGYYGVGKYKAKHKGKDTLVYKKWHSMLERCYSKRWLAQEKNVNYRGCTVCKEWHNFQTFAEWFELNYIEGFELDKDKKISGNKEYSPTACTFLSKKENITLASAKHYLFINPQGEEVYIYNLSEYCRNTKGVEVSSMSALVTGKLTKYKGWSFVKYVLNECDTNNVQVEVL